MIQVLNKLRIPSRRSTAKSNRERYLKLLRYIICSFFNTEIVYDIFRV